MTTVPEKSTSLWFVIVSPVIWSAHFLASYITAALWCAKWAGPDGSLGAARWAIAAYTFVALIAIGLVGRAAYARHGHGQGSPPHDADTPEDRHRFLGYSTFLLSVLSAVATAFSGLVIIFIWNCH